MRRTPLVTLTTDIGWAYAAQVKAVLLRRAPNLRIVDVAHDIRPQGVREAAFVLRHVVPRFPAGTIHVAIVDPGVGGARAAIAIRCPDGTRFVGPDNGVLSLAAEALGGGRAARLDPDRLSLDGVTSATFEGRDVFAAAALASGRALSGLGSATGWKVLRWPEPKRRPDGVAGEVVYVDIFGNAITNIPVGLLPEETGELQLRVRRGRARRVRRVRTYADLTPRGIGVVGSSFGLLELAERD
ncbi:MAG: SAM-dependent chlorinase/fluorinase, partial [Thermoplasmata archaeon]|nr:SAM-dependent chlorinase/fluorinase [Thermoplasmata archaeon]